MTATAALDVTLIEILGQEVARFELEIAGKKFFAVMSRETPDLIAVHLNRPHELFIVMPITAPPSPFEFRALNGSDAQDLLTATLGGPLTLADYLKTAGQLRPVARILVNDFQLGVPQQVPSGSVKGLVGPVVIA